jgi:hypothetical protein
MPVLARIAGHATVTAYRVEDAPGARACAIHHALDEAGVAVQSVTDVWLAGEGDVESQLPIELVQASIHSIRRTTGDCEAADGALCASLAFHQVSNGGGGPALVLNVPPSANQVAVVVVPPDW